MSRKVPCIPRSVSRRCNVILTILSCSLLLTGCANSPQKARPPTALSGAGEKTSLPQQAETGGSATPSGSKAPLAAGGEPAIAFETDTHDFGVVGLRTKHVYEFRFKNVGTGVLRVKDKIDTTCGCAVAALSRTECAPGQEGTIQVVYLAGDTVGPALKHLSVHTNDPRHGGTAQLTIKATLVERVVSDPKRLELRLKRQDANYPPLTLRSQDERAFAVTSILSSGTAITADIDPSRQATEFTLRPRLDAEQLQKNPRGVIVLALTHPECAEIQIPYQVVPEFEFTPSSVVLFNMEPNRPILMRDVSLSNSYGEPFEIASCVSAADRVRVLDKEKVISDHDKSVSYRLRLLILPPSPVGDKKSLEDVLTVRLADGKDVQLPCRIFYREPRVPLAEAQVRHP
jgi:hypothetical protein